MNCGYEIKWSYDLRSYKRNFCNCVKKPEKFRTSTGFEPVISWYQCDAVTNWAMKPLTLGAGHLWVLMFRWGMDQRWNESYINCGYEIKWTYVLHIYKRNLCNCVKKPEKFRTSTGFEPVTSRYWSDALTNWAMKPLTLGAGHLWVLMFPWGMNQRWNDLRSYERNFCNCLEKLSWLKRRTGIARSRAQTPLKSWIFQASFRNCKNCVHNCEDHSFT